MPFDLNFILRLVLFMLGLVFAASLAVAVLIFLMVFFIPRFQTLFAGFDAA